MAFPKPYHWLQSHWGEGLNILISFILLVFSCLRGEGNGTPLQYSSGKSHGWRSLEGCSPWGREESDTTERLHFRFSLSCIGEGNGNPLQCSCLENPRDGGAWWAAVYRVTQSRTRLKWLSSSSSREIFNLVIVFSPEFVSFPCYNFSLLIISRCLYIIF